jgi:hypothetical protein
MILKLDLSKAYDRLDSDSILGCREVMILPAEVIEELHDKNPYTLKQIREPLITDIWQQG